ncbi:MAG: hypothetical protein JEZ09_21580 [Salinivirgaceae bacterium]|nr:hypothetical protein [Salinivirgaceae bacterium]
MSITKGIICLSFIFAFALNAKTQNNMLAYKLSQDTVLQSTYLGYGKHVSIYIPRTFDVNKKYPLLIHFDNEYAQTNSSIDQIDKLTNVGQIPSFVIVAITSKSGYAPRALEVLLPRVAPFNNPRISDEKLKNAKGEKLEQFLFKELLPYMEQSFSADKEHVVLVGHSFYGYYTGYLFSEHIKDLFAVISNSPYFYLGKVNLTKELKANLAKVDNLSRRTYFYCGIGSIIQGDDRWGWKKMMDMLDNTELPEKFSYKSYDYPNAGHNAVPILTTGRALSDIYSKWFIINATGNQQNEDSELALKRKREEIKSYYGISIPLP